MHNKKNDFISDLAGQKFQKKKGIRYLNRPKLYGQYKRGHQWHNI